MDNQTAPNVVYSNHSKFHTIYLIIGIVAIILSLSGISFLLGQKVSTGEVSKTPSSGNIVQIQKAEAVSPNPIFTNQSAVIHGKITNINGSKVTVADSSSGMSDEFELSPQIVIYKQTASSPTASATTNVSALEVNQDALIVLQAANGKYTIASVSYNSPDDLSSQ